MAADRSELIPVTVTFLEMQVPPAYLPPLPVNIELPPLPDK